MGILENCLIWWNCKGKGEVGIWLHCDDAWCRGDDAWQAFGVHFLYNPYLWIIGNIDINTKIPKLMHKMWQLLLSLRKTPFSDYICIYFYVRSWGAISEIKVSFLLILTQTLHYGLTAHTSCVKKPGINRSLCPSRKMNTLDFMPFVNVQKKPQLMLIFHEMGVGLYWEGGGRVLGGWGCWWNVGWLRRCSHW